MGSKRLEEGLERLGLDLDDSTIERLMQYRDELLKWNKVYNLTAVRDGESMISRHLLDSIAVLPHVTEETCLDLGTGAGLPGMVLAIINPEQQWTLLDSNGKKTRFLTHVRIALGLNNVTVVNSRVETWQNDQQYGAVISRAFTELGNFAEFARPLCAADGNIWAMVGKHPDVNVGDQVAQCTVKNTTTLQVPFDDSDRHLVCLQPTH